MFLNITMSLLLRPLSGVISVDASTVNLTNQSTWRTALDVQQANARLTDIAAITPSSDNFVVGDGSNLVAISASSALTAIGAQAANDRLSDVAAIATTADTFVGGDGSNLVGRTASQVRTSLGLPADTNGYLADIAGLSLGAGEDGNMLIYNHTNGAIETASLAGTTYTAGTGLTLTDSEFAVDDTVVATLSGTQALTNKTHDQLVITATGSHGLFYIVQNSAVVESTSATQIIQVPTASNSQTLFRALVSIRRATDGAAGFFEVLWGTQNSSGTCSTNVSVQVNSLLNNVALGGSAFTISYSGANARLNVSGPNTTQLYVSASLEHLAAF